MFYFLFIVGGVVLSSEVYRPSMDFNELCLKDGLVYTCTTSDVLTWTVGTTVVGTYVSGQRTTFVGATRTDAAMPGVVANLTKNGDTLLTSTLMIPSTETVANELEIVCEGSSEIRKSLIFQQKGEIAWSCLTQLVGLTLVTCQYTFLCPSFDCCCATYLHHWMHTSNNDHSGHPEFYQ